MSEIFWYGLFSHLGWINTFLSWEAFEPLAKLSYNIYLVHISVDLVLVAQTTFTASVSDIMVVSENLRWLRLIHMIYTGDLINSWTFYLQISLQYLRLLRIYQNSVFAVFLLMLPHLFCNFCMKFGSKLH